MASTVLDRAERLAELTFGGRLAEASLELGRFVYRDVDTAATLARLDAMAARVDGDTHLALRRVIAIEDGIGGNVDDYHDPANSFLHRVLDTRRGIPISLSVLWIEIGRRAGMEMVGVGLPGHFVVYAGGQMVDPFHYGEALGFDEAAGLVAAALGGAPRLDRSWLSPVDTAGIVRRMLRNLEIVYQGDPRNTEWVDACLEVIG
ncbi:MAG: transglutaminase-like domain-containing protein [Acidimicrobiia bacterium]